MGMPKIPDGRNRPTMPETIIDLLESIALEEMALAHIINAEGERKQEIIKRFGAKEIRYCDVEQSFKDSKEVLNAVIMKEWLLYNKLGAVMELSSGIEKRKNMGTGC